MTTPQLLSTDEAAAFLGVKPATLKKWRVTGEHKLPYVKIGSLVRYRQSDLEKFIGKNTVGAK